MRNIDSRIRERGTDPRDSQGVGSIWQFLERGEADLYVTYRFLTIRTVLFTEARNTDGKQV